MPGPVLAVSDLACRRGDRLLFRGVSFAIAPGEALHVAGPNGIGKSSLIRIAAGLLRPFAGAVARSAPLALTDERLALDPHRALGRALGWWARLDGVPADAVRRGIAAMDLAGLLDVPVRYLSTGQKKRAVLARLVAGGRPLWLLDEPANGLDSDGVLRLEAVIAAHCVAGGSALVASHLPLALPGTRRLALAEHAL